MSSLILKQANIDYYYNNLKFVHGRYARLKDRSIVNVIDVSDDHNQLLVRPIGIDIAATQSVDIQTQVVVISNDLERIRKWIDFNDRDECCYHCHHLMRFDYATGYYHHFICNVCGYSNKSY